MTAAWTLAERELVRFFRQPNRVVGAVLQPLVFWLLFGAAFRGSFRPPAAGQTYQQFFLPGIATLIALFTAIFSTISILEDRREGFLQGVLVAPVRRASLVLGKVLGGALLAVLQGTLFLLLAPFAGVALGPLALLGAAGVLFLVGFALTGLGFCLVWRMDSVQGFHAVMSVLLMPLWLLSGAFFPAAGLPGWLAWAIRLNPLTYGVEALRIALGLAPGPAAPALGVTAAFGVATFLLACLLARRRTRVDLR